MLKIDFPIRTSVSSLVFKVTLQVQTKHTFNMAPNRQAVSIAALNLKLF